MSKQDNRPQGAERISTPANIQQVAQSGKPPPPSRLDIAFARWDHSDGSRSQDARLLAVTRAAKSLDTMLALARGGADAFENLDSDRQALYFGLMERINDDIIALATLAEQAASGGAQ